MNRCWWAGEDPLYQDYHDREWGRPQRDERVLFEMLMLEMFQAGLSWITILRKRDNFRRAFAGWDIAKIAAFGSDDVTRLMNDAGIVRNKAKIAATIHNAKLIDGIRQTHGSLANYLWQFQPKNRKVPVGGFQRDTLPLLIDEAKVMSKALKKDGFLRTGPMTCMSFMQSVGMINDHVADCDLCPY